MPPLARRLLLFGLQFFGLLIVVLLLYPVVLPWYERLVVVPANLLLKGMFPPVVFEVLDGGKLDAYIRHPSGGRIDFMTKAYEPYTIFISLPLFPALLLATPLPWKRRLRALGYGMLGVFALQLLSLVVSVRTTLCLQENPEAFLCSWFYGLSLSSGQLGAILIWSLCTWSYWLAPILGQETSADQAAATSSSG